MTIGDFLIRTTNTFRTAGIQTARLDTLVLLERSLNQNKAWLLAHVEQTIAPHKQIELETMAKRRAKREPLAYIVGRQEFYGRQFLVGPDVLIPRPETEQLIDLLKTLPLPDNALLLDVGTGSGAIAVTAARELPHLRVEACDISPAALKIATQNAEKLGASVTIFTSDLLGRVEKTYDAIIANLPYVAPDWERSPETAFEPAVALFAENSGLALIEKLIATAPRHLNKQGFLLLEADPRQFTAIKTMAESTFTVVRSEGFALVLQKI